MGGHAADRQSLGCDVRRGRGAGRGELIIARRGAAQVQARGGYGFAVGNVLVGERRCAAAQADIVAANHAANGAGRDGGRRRAVVNLAVRCDAARYRLFGDAEGLIHTGRGVPVGIARL